MYLIINSRFGSNLLKLAGLITHNYVAIKGLRTRSCFPGFSAEVPTLAAHPCPDPFGHHVLQARSERKEKAKKEQISTRVKKIGKSGGALKKKPCCGPCSLARSVLQRKLAFKPALLNVRTQKASLAPYCSILLSFFHTTRGEKSGVSGLADLGVATDTSTLAAASVSVVCVRVCVRL